MSKRHQLCQELGEEHSRPQEQQIQRPRGGSELATKTGSLWLEKGEIPFFKFMLLEFL